MGSANDRDGMDDMSMRVLRSDEYVRMPWKNGGGETSEVAVSPSHASLDTLDWRISLASVATDGPFSKFRGVVRTLCVLEGAGIRLYVGGEQTQLLLESSDPYTFDGEIDTTATLVAGPIVDLNVMSRRSGFRHTVKRCERSEPLRIETGADWLIVFCHRGAAECNAGADTALLAFRDCAILESPLRQPVTVSPVGTMDLRIIEIYREFAASAR
jgi:environmental stress-induced protein Ves